MTAAIKLADLAIDFANVSTDAWTDKGKTVRRNSKRFRCLAVMYAMHDKPWQEVFPAIGEACELPTEGEQRSYYKYLAEEGFAPGHYPGGTRGRKAKQEPATDAKPETAEQEADEVIDLDAIEDETRRLIEERGESRPA